MFGIDDVWMALVLLTFDTSSMTHMTIYRQVSNVRGKLVGDKIVDHLDVVGTSPVGAAPTTSSFST